MQNFFKVLAGKAICIYDNDDALALPILVSNRSAYGLSSFPNLQENEAYLRHSAGVCVSICHHGNLLEFVQSRVQILFAMQACSKCGRPYRFHDISHLCTHDNRRCTYPHLDQHSSHIWHNFDRAILRTGAFRTLIRSAWFTSTSCKNEGTLSNNIYLYSICYTTSMVASMLKITYPVWLA